MKTIWKYVIDPRDPVVKMAKSAQIITVREQGELICVWALVDTTLAALEYRRFKLLVTGEDISDEPNLDFLGTAMLQGGSFVIHVFEDLRP